METYDLSITQGSSFGLTLTARNSDLTYINLSGFGVRGYVRYKYGSSGILYDLQPIIHPSYVSGLIVVSGNATGTAALPVVQGVYDIEIYDSGTYALKVLRGYANISPESTY